MAVAGAMEWKRRWLSWTPASYMEVSQHCQKLPLLDSSAHLDPTPQSTTAKPAVTRAGGDTLTRWSRRGRAEQMKRSEYPLAASPASCKQDRTELKSRLLRDAAGSAS